MSKKRILKKNLIDKWKDKLFKTENRIYQYPNGLKLLTSINPSSLDYDFSVVVKGGAYFERQIGVPTGTSHFLEHILFGNPNKIFKTKDNFINIKYGNKSRASFYNNATTTRRFLYFYAHGNYEASLRMTRFVLSQIDFPFEKVREYMEKEHNIIKGEIIQRPKEAQNSSLQFEKFMWGDIYPEFSEDVLGSLKELKSITADNITKFYHEVFKSSNLIITIQTPKPLTKELEAEINRFADNLDKSKVSIKEVHKDMDIRFKFKHFKEPSSSSVFFSASFFYKITKKMDYKRDRLFFFITSLFDKIGYDYLREEKKLVYSPSVFNERILFQYKNRGVSMECAKDNFLEVLDETYYMLYEYSKKFLMTKEGYRWFISEVSNYIFNRTNNFDSNYAENIGTDIIDNEDYKFDYNKAKQAAKDLTVNDLVKFIDEFLKIEPSFWIVSSHKDDEINNIFMQSKFYKRFAKKK